MSVIEALQQWVSEQGISHEIITGNVSLKQRNNIIKRFQDGQFDIIICTIGAAGVGVTLTKSHHIIMVEKQLGAGTFVASYRPRAQNWTTERSPST